MTARAPSLASDWRKGFWALMITQFQNGFSDLALKTLVVFLVLSRPMPDEERSAYVAYAGALFSAPFILFSMFAGWLADRFSKQQIMTSVKCAEVLIMLFASIALHLDNLYLELASVFLMGCHSAVFSPSKYGILPEIVPANKLSWGNGVLELLTFFGIILGTVAGGLLATHMNHDRFLAGLALALLAVAGWYTSRKIPKVPAADPSCLLRINPITDLIKQLRLMRKDRDLWRANWGNTGFWYVATLEQMNLTIFAKNVLHLTDDQNGYLNAALAIGIGVGSAAAGALSRGRIQYGLVPLGAAGLAISTIPMGFAGVSVTTFSVCLVFLGLMGGFFIVPIASVLQYKPTPETRGAVLAAANLVSFMGIFAVSGVQILLNKQLGLTPGEVFWVCGVIALLSGFYAVATRREALRALVESFRQPVPKE
jgi:acyl-[acyl-carrier-protein]-phospholipid O-acyltransferase/long-chain-fatty-acid--[acyl-carrier-protein] ligase